MDDEMWTLMDARAFSDVDAATVLMVGTCAECCKEANDGTYGSDCIVVDPQGETAFHLFSEGRWIPPARKGKRHQ